MASHSDLQAEQAHIDRAYDRLEAMRRAAEALGDSVLDAGKGGTHQARVERDVFVQTSLARLEQLQLGRASLVFGRIDVEAGPEGDGESAERFYIGRLAVSDEGQEPLVVDWRAPIAEGFYRATGRSPMGLRRRRHFATEGRRLLAIEDELFRADVGEGEGDANLDLVGPGALLAALQRSRSGQMRDIVATVQREQDEIIRAELPGVLVVQGGPGTGKTAVALHRAAYLLYTHRFVLERQGVLVVGPNQLFLRYIQQVLPSLGESGVALTTLGGLIPAIRPRHTDTIAAARVKGSARMAQVLARAADDRERGLRRDLIVGVGSLSLRVTAGMTRGIVATVKRRPGPHNPRRRQVETLLFRALYDQYVAAVGRRRALGLGGGISGSGGAGPDSPSAGSGPAAGPAAERGSVGAPEPGAGSPPGLGADKGTGLEDVERGEFVAGIRREPAVVAALDRMWPRLSAEDFLNDLLGSAALLGLASKGLLSVEEREAIARSRARQLDEVPWTPADLPLLDEARALLGPLRPPRRGEHEDELRKYGHIVVDEAQDISPMAWRMLSRRSIAGSMTLVGDIGQATGPIAPREWSEILEHIPSRRPPRVTNLTVNYRTPAEVMEVASAVLAAAGLAAVRTPTSVRATGMLPVVRSAREPGHLADEVARAAVDELDAVGDGTVAVIATQADHALIGAALDATGARWGAGDSRGLTEPVTLLDVAAAKGLEFDSVIVVEPAAIVADTPEGLRALFVALTRPTRRLVAVNFRPLPESLAQGLARARSGFGEGPGTLWALDPDARRSAG